IANECWLSTTEKAKLAARIRSALTPQVEPAPAAEPVAYWHNGMGQVLTPAELSLQDELFASRFDQPLYASPAPDRRAVAVDDETYEIGKRDGYEQAVQDIDCLTGGDGEYRV